MTGRPLTASVVMATYHRRALLPRVLEALLADPATTEVVVVVDGDRDGSLELLQEWSARDPRVRPVWTENRGAAGAQQLGLEHARGDVVVMFDDDQLASPGMVGRHVAHHAAAGGLLVVGPVHTPPPERPAPGSFVLEAYVRAYERDLLQWAQDPSTILENLWGGNLSLRRADALRIGWHSPEFPYNYHYDHDFGLRCRDAGLRPVYDPALAAQHVFTKDIDSFLRDGRMQGRVAARVAVAHPELASLFGTFRPRRTVVHLARTNLTFRVARRVLRSAVGAAGRLRQWRVERRLGQLLWDLERHRGVVEERRSWGASGRPPGA